MFALNNSIREHNNLTPLKPRNPDSLNTNSKATDKRRKSFPAKIETPTKTKKKVSFSPKSARKRISDIDKRYEEFKKKSASKPNEAFEKFMALTDALLKEINSKNSDNSNK